MKHAQKPRPTIAILAMLALAIACNLPMESGGTPSQSAATIRSASPRSTSPIKPASPTLVPTETPTVQADNGSLELTEVPYPTPSDSAVQWSDIFDLSELEWVQWAELDAGIVADTSGLQLPLSVSYPQDWFVLQPVGHALSIQNVSPESYPEYQGPLAKFEVLWLRDEPRANAALGEVITVMVSGERSIFWEKDWYGMKTIGAVLHESNTYYSVNGFIGRVDEQQYQNYRSIILYMISTLRIGG